MLKIIAILLLLTGCAAPRAPFHHDDSGRMGVMLWQNPDTKPSEFKGIVYADPQSVWK